MPDCYNCEKEGETKQCASCQRAFYCSKTCQKKHWKKHKQNCFPPDAPIHRLFSACGLDLLPDTVISRDYGLDNMRLYHGDVLWGESTTPLSAEVILFGLFKFITKDVRSLELGDTRHIFNSIGLTKKKIVEAYENNALDEFIHRYIRNVFSRHGHASPEYCLAWIWNRLVIGPTRTEGLSREQIQEMGKGIYHKYYGSTNPANCCCVTLDQAPTVWNHIPFM